MTPFPPGGFPGRFPVHLHEHFDEIFGFLAGVLLAVEDRHEVVVVLLVFAVFFPQFV